MLNQEKESEMYIPHYHKEGELLADWEVPFSAQYTFESFMWGRPKHLTKQYKNKQCKWVNDDMEQWGILAGLDKDTILQAQMLFHCVQVSTDNN